MKRREFIKAAAALPGMMMLNTARSAGADIHQLSGEMQYRPLGRTGHHSSVITLGGIVVSSEPQSVANRVVAQALDLGVNQVDVAPTYGDAEVKLGEALRGKRDQVFLGCKTTKRDREGAAQELRSSLRRLQTEYVDLYQFHALNRPEELEQVLGPGGAMEAFEEARAEGLIRFVGITGHRPDTLSEALRRYDFATVMFPQSFVLHHHGFGLDLLRQANEQGVGILAIKPIAERPRNQGEPKTYPKCWYKPFSTARHINLSIRYILSQPVSTAIPSGEVRLFERSLSAARHWRPLEDEERKQMAQIAADLKPLFSEA